jgi:hypothetical protein
MPPLRELLPLVPAIPVHENTIYSYGKDITEKDFDPVRIKFGDLLKRLQQVQKPHPMSSMKEAQDAAIFPHVHGSVPVRLLFDPDEDCCYTLFDDCVPLRVQKISGCGEHPITWGVGAVGLRGSLLPSTAFSLGPMDGKPAVILPAVMINDVCEFNDVRGEKPLSERLETCRARFGTSCVSPVSYGQECGFDLLPFQLVLPPMCSTLRDVRDFALNFLKETDRPTQNSEFSFNTQLNLYLPYTGACAKEESYCLREVRGKQMEVKDFVPNSTQVVVQIRSVDALDCFSSSGCFTLPFHPDIDITRVSSGRTLLATDCKSGVLEDVAYVLPTNFPVLADLAEIYSPLLTQSESAQDPDVKMAYEICHDPVEALRKLDERIRQKGYRPLLHPRRTTVKSEALLPYAFHSRVFTELQPVEASCPFISPPAEFQSICSLSTLRNTGSGLCAVYEEGDEHERDQKGKCLAVADAFRDLTSSKTLCHVIAKQQEIENEDAARKRKGEQQRVMPPIPFFKLPDPVTPATILSSICSRALSDRRL